MEVWKGDCVAVVIMSKVFRQRMGVETREPSKSSEISYYNVNYKLMVI